MSPAENRGRAAPRVVESNRLTPLVAAKWHFSSPTQKGNDRAGPGRAGPGRAGPGRAGPSRKKGEPSSGETFV